jgi:DNA polymerase-1
MADKPVKPVKNKIRPESNIAIVIDTPSDSDTTKGRLMTDKFDQMILNKLAAYGVDYTKVSILSVAQVRHTRIATINAQERLAWQALLERDIAKCKPNVIIAVGEVALRCLTDVVNIEKYKGTPVKCKLLDAIVVPVEKHSYGNVHWNLLTDFYIQKVVRYRHSNQMPSKDLKVIVTKDIELLTREFLNEDYLSNPDSVLGFDIECSSAELTCIGFAKDELTAYVIPLVHMPMSELVPAIRLIDKILRSPVKKIAQNGNFDITYLAYYYKIKVENFFFDTMLAWHSCFPNVPKDIGTINSVCTDEPFWKDDGKQWTLPYDQINWPQFFDYNGKDTANLLTIMDTEKQLLDMRDTWSTFDREMALCYPLVAMELDGINIDQAKVLELKTETGILIDKWQLYLDTLLEDKAINVGSWQQIRYLLYDQLKLPTRVRKGQVVSDEDALLSLLPLNPTVVKPIMILKKLKKEYSEYKVKIAADGRMRSTFKPAGTMTGRLASSKSITGTGTNFQNRTKKIRVYFVTDNHKTPNLDDEQVLINADYSKAESWIVAALAEDYQMLEMLQGPDFHSANASQILGKHVDKSMYSDYQLGKRVSHGANYRMTAFLLQKVLLKDGYSYTKTESGELMEAYHAAYPNIRNVFHRRVEQQLNRNRTLVNTFGRKVTFDDPWGTELLNAATAWEPQGTVGDMTNTGLINIYQRIPEVQLKVQVHDSVVLQAYRRDITPSLRTRILDCMRQELTINKITFTIPVDIEIGENWKDLQDWAA